MVNFSAFYSEPKTYVAPNFNSFIPNIKSIFLSGAKYYNKESRIFGWYGIPKKENNLKKVPGIVLLHGGLGTAFAPWVEYWNKLGYAAIAIDIFGGLPANDGNYCSNEHPKLHQYSGANYDDKFNHLDEEVENQWCYHAISAAITARSFLASLNEVDEDNIGLTGISWGGYIAALTAGFCPKFKFIMPVYACGGRDFVNLVVDKNNTNVKEKFFNLWNPNNNLSKVTTPMLWVNGANDPFFDVYNWSITSGLGANSYRLLKPTMVHSQKEGEKSLELATFANFIINNKKYPKITSAAYDKVNQKLIGSFDINEPIESSQLYYTRASGNWNDCVFRAIQAKVDTKNKTLIANLPNNWTAAYLIVNVKLEDKIIACSSSVIFNEENNK